MLFVLSFHNGLLETSNSSFSPINGPRRDQGVLIPKQNHRDTLLGVLQERRGARKVSLPSAQQYLYILYIKEGSVVEETHHTGSHASCAAPPLLHFGGGVRLGFVVSAADLFHLPVETI